MAKIIEYFIKNRALNHTLLLFLLILGVYSYQKIPKEIFPVIELDKILINGGYAGASASNLDKMAVRDIESSLNSIEGIEKIETTVLPGSFSILISLQSGVNKIEALNKIKDAIAKSRQYLPSDMTEPVATLLTHHRPLISLSLSSNSLTFGELIEAAKEIKSKISRIDNISEVKIFGDSDKEISIRIDTKALKAFNLPLNQVISAISSLSYIYPIGEVKQRGDFFFISTVHGAKDEKMWREMLIKIGDKFVRLKDIAQIKFTYPQQKTLSTFNGRRNITLKISKGESGDSMALSKELREFVKKLQKDYPKIHFDFYRDSSKFVKNRLDIVISNLMFGFILVFASMAVLINFRIAFIVAMGIPFAFAIGIIFLYFWGYSINIISLLGALIVIGIVVDDAIVVAENIQRYINEGLSKDEAVIKGLKEMLLPVTLATVTTVAAFLPLFMMSGEIKNFIILIPIAVIMILIGSLVESFLFLPLHAKEFLKKQRNFVDWKGFQDLYERFLHTLIKYKKSFLSFFLIVIPVLTIFTVKSMHFQFFPTFDGNYLFITGKLDINTPIKDTMKIASKIERDLLKKRDKFFIKSISTVVGVRRSTASENETGENMFYITLELYEMKPEDFINRYLNPILNLSFDFNDPNKKRTLHTYELSKLIKKELLKYEKRYKIEDFGVIEERPGLIKSDIWISFVGKDDSLIVSSIEELKKEISKFKGIKDISDNIQYGKKEYKIKINSYGERLGFSEAGVARALSGYFLDNRRAMSFDKDGVMEIKTRALKKDNNETFFNFELQTSDGKWVKLKDIADFIVKRDYEKIEKRDGEVVKSLFINVDKHIITPEEMLNRLSPYLKEIKKRGIGIKFYGEKEKNRQLAHDMKIAVILALFLILITLLFIFPKLRYAFMVMSVIPLSLLGAFLGHKLLGINLTMPSMIGLLGLAGVVINDGIIMLDFLHGTNKAFEFFERAKLRLRPILITSITTFLGLFSLIFYATGQAVILQPIAVSLGFGLLWGTVLNLIYLPALYAVVNKIELKG